MCGAVWCSSGSLYSASVEVSDFNYFFFFGLDGQTVSILFHFFLLRINKPLRSLLRFEQGSNKPRLGASNSSFLVQRPKGLRENPSAPGSCEPTWFLQDDDNPLLNINEAIRRFMAFHWLNSCTMADHLPKVVWFAGFPAMLDCCKVIQRYMIGDCLHRWPTHVFMLC